MFQPLSDGEYEYDTYTLGVYPSETDAFSAYERVASDFDGYSIESFVVGAPALSMHDLMMD